ncbi:type II secretion system protein [Halocella sp. SP3-1]|nr:type II secretion system protein [Halocella sp. SP3-1]
MEVTGGEKVRVIKNNSESAFTLIEVLLAVSIIALLTTVIYSAFLSSTVVLDFNREKLNIQQDHRIIVDRIAPYIRMAKTVTINNSYNSNQDKVRFTFSTIEAGSGDYNGIGFGIKNDGELYYRKKIADSEGNFNWGNRITFISSKANKFELSKNNKMITITVELEEKDGESYTFVEEFYRRITDNNG